VFSQILSKVLATLATTATLRDEAFALRPLAGQLARTANGFSLLASLLLRRLFIMIAALHLAESTFPLHLLFQRAERLLHIIVAHNDLYDGSLSIRLDARAILTSLVRQRRGYYQSYRALSTLSSHMHGSADESSQVVPATSCPGDAPCSLV